MEGLIIMFWNFVICFGIVWIIQSFFSFMQGIYMRNTMKALSEYGSVFFAKNSGFLRSKVIVLAAIDKEHRIIEARKLIPKIFRFPKIFNFDEAKGQKLGAFDTTITNLDPYTISAMDNLSKDYFKRIASIKK